MRALMVRQYEYQPCIPTRETKVPAGPDWFHEIKHDGYRLIVQRDGARVRLFTRNGHDWTSRCPLIVEAVLKTVQKLKTLPAVRGERKSKPGSRLDRFTNLRI